jgi:hypothetical protein
MYSPDNDWLIIDNTNTIIDESFTCNKSIESADVDIIINENEVCHTHKPQSTFYCFGYKISNILKNIKIFIKYILRQF